MKAMLLKLSAVSLLALLSLSPPQTPADEIAALKRQMQELKAQQASMLRDLETIKAILTQAQAPAGDPFVNRSIVIANEPSRGSASAKVTLVEVSDYHCPFCRRQTLQTITSTPGRSATSSSTTRSPSSTPTPSRRTKPRPAPATRASTGKCTTSCSPTRRRARRRSTTRRRNRLASIRRSSPPA